MTLSIWHNHQSRKCQMLQPADLLAVHATYEGGMPLKGRWQCCSWYKDKLQKQAQLQTGPGSSFANFIIVTCSASGQVTTTFTHVQRYMPVSYSSGISTICPASHGLFICMPIQTASDHFGSAEWVPRRRNCKASSKADSLLHERPRLCDPPQQSHEPATA